MGVWGRTTGRVEEEASATSFEESCGACLSRPSSKIMAVRTMSWVAWRTRRTEDGGQRRRAKKRGVGMLLAHNSSGPPTRSALPVPTRAPLSHQRSCESSGQSFDFDPLPSFGCLSGIIAIYLYKRFGLKHNIGQNTPIEKNARVLVGIENGDPLNTWEVEPSAAKLIPNPEPPFTLED